MSLNIVLFALSLNSFNLNYKERDLSVTNKRRNSISKSSRDYLILVKIVVVIRV